ncbi:MAG TPA: type IX secretion system membrane protein PorP/SprF [Bacteroidales bacterium]|nr:type IX secretion system membrane protein PorP/SprF [Bacteroidales bacterium]
MKNTIKYILSLVLMMVFFANAEKVSGQQAPLYSQYMFNKYLINPAVAGSEGYTAFNVLAREQWVGMKDAPFTHAICAQTRVSPRSWLGRLHQVRSRSSAASRMSKVGLGAYVFNDHRGLIDQTGIQLTYAYHLNLDEAQLSFGLSTMFIQYAVNKSKLQLDPDFNASDKLVDNSSLKMISPDFTFGAYYTTPEWYVGFSAAQLIQSALKFGNMGDAQFSQRRHYFLMGGYRFDINKQYSVEPSMLFKTTEQFNYQADLGARVYYKNEYWGGLAYRTGGAIIVTAGIRYDKFYFGYSFDYTLNKLQSYSYGSHELMVAYKFGMNIRQSKWLERY